MNKLEVYEMCLLNEVDIEAGDEQKYSKVWKVFTKWNGELHSLIIDNDKEPYLEGNEYTSEYGFHAFTNRNDAESLAETVRGLKKRRGVPAYFTKGRIIVRQIRTSNLICKGTQGYNRETLLQSHPTDINALRCGRMIIPTLEV